MSMPWMLGAVVLGVIAAVFVTFPLVTRAWDSIVTLGDCEAVGCGDYMVCLWALAEGGRRLYTAPLAVFDANTFHPLRHTLAYSESILAGGALVAPLNALTGNPILGYNALHLASIVLSVVGCFLLVREITGDPRAALLSGWFCGLLIERRMFFVFTSILVHWVPFLLWAWVRFLSAPRLGRGLVLAVLVVAQMHTSAYFGLMLPVLLVPWALALAALGPWPFRRWLLSGAVVGAAVATGLALYLPYLAVRAEVQYTPRAVLAGGWGMYLQPFTEPGVYLTSVRTGGVWPYTTSPLPVVVPALAAVAIALRRPHVRRPAAETAHLVAALAFTVAAMSVSLGPHIDLGPWIGPVRGPFYYLHLLPGFATMRATMRFALLAACGGSILVGIAIATLLRRIRTRLGVGVFVVIAAVVVTLDARILGSRTRLTRLVPPSEAPAVYRWLATTPPDTAVLEVPYGPWRNESFYMLYSLYHGRRIMNGYSTVMPRFRSVLLAFPNPRSIRSLQDAGIRYVIVHRNRYRDAKGKAFLARMKERVDAGTGIVAQRSIGDAWVLEIAPPEAGGDEPAGPELDGRGWRVEGSDPGTERAADGRLETHWTASGKARDNFLRIDLGRVAAIEGVTLRLGRHALEYPWSYTVWASDEGARWRPIGGEPATLPPFASYRRDHTDVELPLVTRVSRARYLEIRVPQASPMTRKTWGVHEVRIRGRPEGEPPGVND